MRRARSHDERASYNHDGGENKAEAALLTCAMWRTLLHKKPRAVSHFLDSAGTAAHRGVPGGATETLRTDELGLPAIPL